MHRPPPPPPPGPPPPEGLPPGWSEHRDATGRTYYHNTRTNETTWTRPAASTYGSAPPPPPPPPPEAPGFHQYGSASAIAASNNNQGGYASAPPGVTHRDSSAITDQGYGSEYGPPGGYPAPLPAHGAPDPYGGYPASHHGPPPPHHGGPPPHHHGGPPPQYGPAHGVGGAYPSQGYNVGPPRPAHAQSYASNYGGYGAGNAGMAHQASGYGYGPTGPAAYAGAGVGGGRSGKKEGGTEVMLEFSATGLKKKDLIGKSDPMVVVFMEGLDRLGQKKWNEAGRTEKIMNNHSPRWAKRVRVSYRFYEMQRMRLAVFDVDKTGGLNYDDELGMVETDLGHIMSAGVFKASLKKMSYAKGVPQPVRATGSQGELSVRVHNASVEGQSKVFLTMSAEDLDKKDGMLGKSDPYFIVNQLMPSQDYSVIYKSETLKKTLNPTWKPAEFVMNTHGQAPHNVHLRIDCYDWDKFTPHDLIGRANVTLSHLASGTTFPLINESKQKRKGKRYTDSGKMQVSGYRLVHFPQFHSYIQAGLKIHLTVGIDFTASNGPPSHPQSLHKLNNMQFPNQYIQALESVGQILHAYTRDGTIAAYGFGAKLPPSSVPSFNFTLDPNGNPYCYGVDGLVETYRQRVSSIDFAGPTNFAPLINTAREIAARDPLSARNLSYHCLLILTDGAITDMRETVDTIIDCTHTIPLSIIIIGVGNADFSKMNVLDADDQVLSSADGRKKAKRDIVQFVAFRKYANDPTRDGLSADVLAELPSRIVETMVDTGIVPDDIPSEYFNKLTI